MLWRTLKDRFGEECMFSWQDGLATGIPNRRRSQFIYSMHKYSAGEIYLIIKDLHALTETVAEIYALGADLIWTSSGKSPSHIT